MLPIYDAVSMMLRRILRGQSPFVADREHLHHIFLLAGFTVGETVVLMCGFALAGMLVGLLGNFLGVPDIWLAGAFLLGGLLCRRALNERRTLEQTQESRSTIEFAGEERRVKKDRRRT
jgi:UDP-GlcNAc:undecaprenyl-phosphate GlcNAc-1-phosphate transferase